MFFIDPAIRGHLDYNLGCVFVLATVNNAAINLDAHIYIYIYIYISFQVSVLVSLGEHSDMELLDRMVFCL